MRGDGMRATPDAVWIDDTPFCPVCQEILSQEDQDFDTCATCGRDEDYLEDDDGQPDEQQEWADYDPDC